MTRSALATFALLLAVASPAPAALVTTNLIQHLDADTNVAATGSNVTSWAPVGGTGDTVTTNSGSPQLNTAALNGRNTITLADDRMIGTDNALFDLGAGDFTWYLVARPADNGAGNNRFFGTLENAGSFRGLMGSVTAGEVLTADVRVGAGTVSATDASASLSEWHVWTAIRSGATLDLYRDGLLVGSNAGAGGTLASDALTIGAERTGGAEFVDGDIAALLVYDTQLTPAQFNDTGFFLADRFGIASSFTAPVPEPSTALLLGIGLVGLAVRRRRSNRRWTTGRDWWTSRLKIEAQRGRDAGRESNQHVEDSRVYQTVAQRLSVRTTALLAVIIALLLLVGQAPHWQSSNIMR
ncbi:MAG: LamG domain-containing protein [Planctomycetales bacterium]|nr:LamG domain-containing protein [Planctomycetales bacterium]